MWPLACYEIHIIVWHSIVCVLCQPVHSLIHPYVHQLDFFSEIFLWRLVYAVVCACEDRVGYCKVALATLRTELTRIQDGGYTAVDPTSPGLSTPYKSFTV